MLSIEKNVLVNIDKTSIVPKISASDARTPANKRRNFLVTGGEEVLVSYYTSN